MHHGGLLGFVVLIWLLPVVGAAIVFSVLASEEAYDRRDGGGQSS
jgi:hypothetical protein